MIFKNTMFSKMFLIRRATPPSVRRKLLWSAITILPLLWSQLAFGSALSNLAASMQPGQWVAFPTNGFNNAAAFQISCFSNASLLQYQDKANWLQTNGTAIVIGGIHMSTTPGCFGTKVMRYTESNNTWDEAANVVPDFDTAWVFDPQGSKFTTGHNYHNDTASTVTGDVYHKQNSSGKVMRWNAASNAWSQCTPLPSASWQVTAALEYFPDRNSLVMLDGDWGVWEQVLVNGDCTVNSWVQRASTVGGGFSPQLTGTGDYNVQSKYSARCHCIVLGGGKSPGVLYRYNSNGTFSNVSSSGAPGAILVPGAGANGTVFTADPATGYILAWWDQNAHLGVYQYDPLNDAWTFISSPNTFFSGGVNQSTLRVAIPISTYGVIMMMYVPDGGGGNIYLYKHAAGSGSTPPSPTTPPPDTQAPTAPTGLSIFAISSSQINLSWTASTDNVGVTGYLVERCQASGCSNFAQITTSPGTTFTDAGLSASMSYSYRVRATDAAGKLSGYSTVASASTQAGNTPVSGGGTTGTPVSGGVTTGDQDFAQRCAAAGILRCFSFDSSGDLNFAGGGQQGAWGSNYGYIPPYGTSDYTRVTLDTTQKASGASSLRFTIPSNVGSDVAGAWFANFTPNLSYQVGEGQEVYIQWRQRFSSELLATQYLSHGFKLVDASGGDLPACSPGSANSTNCPTSCWDFEVVVQEHLQTGIPITYANCAGQYAYAPMYGMTSNVTIQNAVECLYPNYASPPCVKMVANEWMTFQLHIKVGNWNTWSSTVQLWIAREGQPSVLVIDCSPTAVNKCSNAPNGWYLYNSNPTYKIGKIWLVPYQTSKDPSQVTPTAYTWYDDLIISTSKIPDPGNSGGGGNAQPPAAPTSLTLQ